jgi:hypothetical protein
MAAHRGRRRLRGRHLAAQAPDRRARRHRSRGRCRGRERADQEPHRACAPAAGGSRDPGARLASELDLVPVRTRHHGFRGCDGRRGLSPKLRAPLLALAVPCRGCIWEFTSGRMFSSEASWALRSAWRLPVSCNGPDQGRQHAQRVPERAELALFVSVDRRDRGTRTSTSDSLAPRRIPRRPASAHRKPRRPQRARASRPRRSRRG